VQPDGELAELNAHAGLERWFGVGERFELTRFVLLRLLRFVYTAAFLSLALQVIPLLGAHGITPAARREGHTRLCGLQLVRARARTSL
jgi:hypothetical protein